LRYDEYPEQFFRMRGLQDVPVHRGDVMPLPAMDTKLAANRKRSGRVERKFLTNAV